VLNQQRVGGNFSASPVWAEGRIYFASEEGEVVVVREGQGMEVLARNALGEMIQASPAISGGRLFVRTATHLWAFRQ
jgi:outer membrane protein assembly factor BamB